VPGVVSAVDSAALVTDSIWVSIGADHATNLATVDTRVDALYGAGAFGQRQVRKTYTFSTTTAGTKTLFTVTGEVVARVAAFVKTAVTATSTASVGVGAETTVFLVDTLVSRFAVDEIWLDASPDKKIESLSDTMKDFVISDGGDIVLTLSTTIKAGALDFTAVWTPLSSDGNVVPA